MAKEHRKPSALALGEERNYGIDVLKILSMLMIVTLHVLNKGGILGACPVGSGRWFASWIPEAFCYGAVNLFAMATGYLMVNRRFRLSRVVNLWLQVFFYSLGITALMALLSPGVVTGEDWCRAIFPVAKNQYWYFSAYFLLSFLTPFLNGALNATSRQAAKLVLVAMFLLLSVMATLSSTDVFCIHKGYSPFWLIFMYLVGGYLRKYDPLVHWSKSLCFLVFGLLSLVTGFSLHFFRYIPILTGRRAMLLRYISPTVFLAALFLMGSLTKLRVKSKPIQKILVFLSPLTFGVYLIHTHHLVFEHLLADSFRFLVERPAIVMLLEVLLASLGIFLVCLVLEALRQQLFRLLRIPNLVDKCSGWVTKKLFQEPMPAHR